MRKLIGCIKTCQRLVHIRSKNVRKHRTLASSVGQVRRVNDGRRDARRFASESIQGRDRTLYNTNNGGGGSQQFKALGDLYSTAKASHTSWKTDVNLAPPPSSWKGQPPSEDKYIRDYYNSLQYTLFETGYPETVDRTASPRTDHNPENVTVAVLASPFECIGTLLEGGKQLPDGFHLILSPSWLSRTQSTIKPGTTTLLVNKAITFGKNGASYIDEFKTPRRVTYFLNLLTENVTGGQRSDGEAMEENIDCPISGSLPLVELIDNKLWTRQIMSDVGMAIPATLGLVYKSKLTKGLVGSSELDVKEVSDSDIENTEYIEEIVMDYLNKLKDKGVDKVVVKPSGPMYYGSIGVSFHPVDDTRDVTESVVTLLEEIEPGGAVLVESFEEFEPVHSDVHDRVPWCADNKMSFRIKVTVCRSHNDTPVTTMITCVAGSKTSPINGDNGVSQTLDSMLLGFGVTDITERQRLQEKICSQSEAVCQRVLETERDQLCEEQLLPGAQTDVIGIDLIISRRNGELTPVGIEVNSHDCTINCQIAEFMSALRKRLVSPQRGKHEPGTSRRGSTDACWESEGGSVRPWVQTMICRSQRHLMKGKKMVVIGAGGYSKRKIWTDAREYGIEVILVESNKDHFARDLVSNFIHYDFDDHSSDVAHACNIANILEIQGFKVDGCLTFWEDCVPLAALVCQNTGLVGSSFCAALNAKKKSRTQSVLGTKKDDIPHWPRTYLYSSNVCNLNNSDPYPGRNQRIKYPAILKLEHGSSAVGVSLAGNERELHRRFIEVSENLKSEADFSGIGLGHDNSMIVMDYHEGSEHDVDIVMFGRKPIAAFISDNGPTRIPRFTETAAVMPSTLPCDKQAQLVTAAYQCCAEIGLSDGVFNVEMKMTSTGPKLIEINARMGGFYLRDWIQKLYGVDIMLYSFMVASGIRPYFPIKTTNQCLMGVMLLPSLHSHILNNHVMANRLRDLQNNGDVIWSQFAESIEGLNDIHEEPFGNVAVVGESFEETKVKLLKVCNDLKIDTDEYRVSHFTQHFNRNKY